MDLPDLFLELAKVLLASIVGAGGFASLSKIIEARANARNSERKTTVDIGSITAETAKTLIDNALELAARYESDVIALRQRVDQLEGDLTSERQAHADEQKMWEQECEELRARISELSARISELESERRQWRAREEHYRSLLSANRIDPDNGRGRRGVNL